MITKSVLVLLGTGLLLALASMDAEPRRAFRSGHEYSYDYDGQVASSLSNGDQYAVSRFRSLVKLNFVTDKLVTVQLEQPQMGQWNEYFDRPHEFHKFDKFESVEIKSNHIEKLNLPFQIRFTNGKVSEVTFHSDDVTFSENVKRAVVNTLQVQLENPAESQVEEREADSYSFTLNETTIEGECESLYTVLRTSSESEKIDFYNVTKAVDFSRCQYRPELRYNYFRYAEAAIDVTRNLDEKTAQKYIHSNPALDISSVYEFYLHGDRRQFIVKEAKISSKYSYEMMDGERVHMVTYALAQLNLKNVERKEASEQMASVKPSASIVYSDAMDVLRERFIAEGDETYLRQNPYMRMPNAVTIVTNIMKRLLETATEKSVEGLDEHAARYLTQLVSILRLCSRSDIQTIHQNLFAKAEYNDFEKTFMQSILADAMAISGTKNTLDHLFSKIKDGELGNYKAATTLYKLMNLRIVSTETVKSLHSLCQSSRVQGSTVLKRTCMLTYGSMVNAMCSVDSPFKHSDKYTTASMNKYCDAATKMDIAKDAMNLYKKASTRADKILALKTIGNMGLENTVMFLEEIIRDLNVEKLIRIQAIDSLRNLRTDMNRRVQRILLPLVQDRREHPEIRMNAIYRILHSRPEKSVLDYIMLEMLREPNTHVKNFVNQVVREMSKNADKVYDRETAQTLKSMLRHFNLYSDDDKTTFATSKFFSSVVAVDQWQLQELASKFDFAALFSNDSRLPKELMASWSLLSNQRLIPSTYQVGMHTQDLEQLLERLYQTWESKKNFDDVLVRGPRSIADESMTFLKNIYHRMKIATRRLTSEAANPVVMLYSRWQNMDTIFCLTDEDSLPQLLESFIVDGKVDVSAWELKNMKFNWASASYQYEQQIKTPTICGIPLLTTIRIPTIFVLDGSLSTSFSDKKEDETKVHSARAHLKIEPKVATTVIVKMEMFSPFFTSGIKTFHSAQLRLPLNLIAKVHAPNWWLPEVEIIMPTDEVRLIHLQTRPVTFYRVWPEKSGVFIEAAEKTMIIEDPTAPFHQRQFSHVDPFMGMNVNIDTHFHASPLSSSQRIIGDWLLAGENSLEIKLQPTADSAKTLKLSLSGQMKKSKNIQSIELPDFQSLFGIQNNQMFVDVERDEVHLIKEQIKMASGNLDHFYHLVFKAEALKGARPHTATVTLKALCDERMSLCIGQNEVNVDSRWSLKMNAHVAMPELRGVVAGFPSQHIIAKVDVGFGSDDGNKMVLNFYGRPSAEKIEVVKRMVNEREAHDVDAIYENAPQTLKPNDFIMVFENKLSPKWNRHMRTLYSYLSFAPFVSMPDLDSVEKEAAKPSHTLMTRLILDQGNYNMTISMPNKQRLQVDLDDAVRGDSRAKTLHDVLRRTHNNEAECSIKKGRFVKTFDGKSVKLPLNECFTLLAKDCTEDSTFAVMAKRTDKFGDGLKLKMINKDKTYEMFSNDKKMVVSVNDYQIAESDYEQHGVFKVAGRNEIYEIRCPRTGSIVRFDGVNIKIQIGDEYMNRQCGICGHYNGDVSDDLRKPDNEEASNLRDFHQSYLYRDSECSPSAIDDVMKPASGKEAEYSMTGEEADLENIEPIQKTITVEEHSKICFSKKPLGACPKESQQDESQRKEAEFICLKRHHHGAQKLLRQLRSEDVIEVPEGHGTEELITVRVPLNCVSASRRAEKAPIQNYF